ncbi:MAG: hypothetical protein WC665_01120 [Sulfurimonas sp.]
MVLIAQEIERLTTSYMTLDLILKEKQDNCTMKIIPVSKNNIQTYLNLAQCYEAEFSALTHKKPDSSGIFELDTHPGESIQCYILTIEEIPAGIAAIAFDDAHSNEMCEFYVFPYFRKNGVGSRFAHSLWKIHPGKWEIKQIMGAEYAAAFWCKTIAQYNDTSYLQDKYLDSYWGQVTRQKFLIS